MLSIAAACSHRNRANTETDRQTDGERKKLCFFYSCKYIQIISHTYQWSFYLFINKSSAIAEMAAQYCTSRNFALERGSLFNALFLGNLLEDHCKSYIAEN